MASSYFLGEKLNLITASGVDIYPTKLEDDYINLRLDNPKITGNVSVEIYDFAGIKVMQKNLPTIEKNRPQRIELNNLKSGVYVVSVVGSNKKVILNKKISVN